MALHCQILVLPDLVLVRRVLARWYGLLWAKLKGGSELPPLYEFLSLVNASSG